MVAEIFTGGCVVLHIFGFSNSIENTKSLFSHSAHVPLNLPVSGTTELRSTISCPAPLSHWCRDVVCVSSLRTVSLFTVPPVPAVG